MTARDPYHHRYFGGYDIYVQECGAPRKRADIVIDNTTLNHPTLAGDA